MEKRDSIIDIVMKVEVDEDPLQIPEDKEEEEKCDEDVSKADEYTIAKDKEYSETLKDLHRKYLIAQNVLKACVKDEPPNISPIQKLYHYTQVPIPELWKSLENIQNHEQKSLKTVIKETKKLEPNETTFIYTDIRDIFIESYVERQQMLSVKELMRILNRKRTSFYYVNMSVTRLIRNNFVKYYYLKDLKSYILTENPDFLYKRHLYLKQVMRYRIEKSIVYVSVQSFKSNNSVFLAASATDGLITSNIFTPTKAKKGGFPVSIEHKVKMWLRNELIPNISTNSVIVLMQPKKENPVPTPSSSRKEMLDWLKNRCIPFDESSHSSQLYKLIKRSKKQYKGFYEDVLESAGFKVLICPSEYNNLDFFDSFKSSIRTNSSDALATIALISTREWKQLEERLVRQEKQIFKEDEQMDNFIENIFQMQKNGGLKKDDFTDFIHATRAMNFAYHIGDFVID